MGQWKWELTFGTVRLWSDQAKVTRAVPICSAAVERSLPGLELKLLYLFELTRND